MKRRVPRGAKHGEHPFELPPRRCCRLQMTVAFDALAQRDLGDHLALIARGVVLHIGAVEGDDDGATDQHHESRVPEDPRAAG